MQKLNFSMLINAPKDKVWHAMLDDQPYREWTKAFNEGSYYKGSLEKGSKILFLGPDPNTGEEGGMVSRIAENELYEVARKWSPAFENYTFNDKDGATEVLVDMDAEDEYVQMFNEMWPKGLRKLKELAEK